MTLKGTTGYWLCKYIAQTISKDVWDRTSSKNVEMQKKRQKHMTTQYSYLRGGGGGVQKRRAGGSKTHPTFSFSELPPLDATGCFFNYVVLKGL